MENEFIRDWDTQPNMLTFSDGTLFPLGNPFIKSSDLSFKLDQFT